VSSLSTTYQHMLGYSVPCNVEEDAIKVQRYNPNQGYIGMIKSTTQFTLKRNVKL